MPDTARIDPVAVQDVQHSETHIEHVPVVMHAWDLYAAAALAGIPMAIACDERWKETIRGQITDKDTSEVILANLAAKMADAICAERRKRIA